LAALAGPAIVPKRTIRAIPYFDVGQEMTSIRILETDNNRRRDLLAFVDE
jgi:hypothetical protein